MSEERKVTVTVCVGSSCHVKGARSVITQFDALLKEHHLQDRVELKGSFCLESCGEGLNWKIDEELLISPTVDAAVQTFRERVIGVVERSVTRDRAGVAVIE